jgi:DNA repair exonuclease SbcCD ATPase subunit
LVAGEFDGQCPVICDACPVEDRIRGMREKARPAYDTALNALGVANSQARTAAATLADIRQQISVFNDWRRRMDDATTRVQTCQELAKGIAKTLEAPPAVPERPDVVGAADALSRVRTALQQYEQAASEAVTTQAALDALEGQLEEQRAAIQILGRGGAQRKIAQSVLGSIETGANRRLEKACIELSLRIVYGRELQSIAEVCDCGKSFPRSATAKACERCGAARGKKRDDKSYVELSNTSGAAEDLAGVALQLAAARWLQRARQSQWSAVMLDEPFGACDKANRQALAKSLSSLMSDGFDQGFCIAHSDDVLDALPHRITITASGQWSRVEVG